MSYFQTVPRGEPPMPSFELLKPHLKAGHKLTLLKPLSDEPLEKPRVVNLISSVLCRLLWRGFAPTSRKGGMWVSQSVTACWSLMWIPAERQKASVRFGSSKIASA